MSATAAVLAIDAGNTRIKWAVNAGDAWSGAGAVASSEARRVPELWKGLPRFDRAFASNVAGEAVAAELAAACAARGVPLTVIRSQARELGVENGYRDPSQLGSDRWAALVAAHALGARDQLVVNAGTALTIDALDAAGRFLGGLIVPGPALMRRALDRGTAGLRLTEGVFDEFAASTPDAITTGALQACAGAIERMAMAMARRGAAPQIVLLAGGAAGELATRLSLRSAIRENLVLEGLVLIARQS